MSSNVLDKSYDPRTVETRWYAVWENEGKFVADDRPAGRTFSIVIPPPNVTGVLHMGHALNATLQDILCRYRRLKGDHVLWLPGTDHAGIATQNVVEKKLAAEGVSRHQLGRDKFIEAVWDWRREYGGQIIHQLKRMGASCDWSRERFTMDEGLSRAVRKVFVQLYHEGLIYRGNYITNWCPRCHTALADLEVEHEEHEGRLYHIRYPFRQGDGGLVVATTRPETMLGDTAVAVNPEDNRYQDLAATEVILPLMERPIPVIRDEYVDTAFGTGALKVTPAHDPNDFEIGQRHQLDNVKVIGEDGRMTVEAGKFAGLDRFECREAVVKALEEGGYLVKIEEHRHGVGHCYRCGTVVEPNLSRQWFVRTKPLAEPAIRAVETGRTRIIPETWAKTYFEWMHNVKDWCISRQIWWGHQIPAWTCDGCGELIVAETPPEACPACRGSDLTQDPDVLDTWFSSALWPFSTLGWPDKTPLLERYYPTSVLVTAFDILFFWVARMMMMGLHFMQEVPFKDVYVHALVRDEEGKKMSKSVGNVIDPLTVIDHFGTDAFRFTLAAFAAQGRDIKMSEKRVEGYRHFINKLWNAARFSLMHLESRGHEIRKEDLAVPDQWILSRLERVTENVASFLDDYRFNEAAAELYQFVWHEFCDWYLEAIKPALYGKEGDVRREAVLPVLWRVMHDILILLHPFVPMVTEEIWHQLPGTGGMLMDAAFPGGEGELSGGFKDPEAEAAMNLVTSIITALRNIRGEMNIAPSVKPAAMIQCQKPEIHAMISSQEEMIVNLARLESLTVQAPGARPRLAATAVLEGALVFVPLEGILDVAQEAARLEKEIEKNGKELAKVSKKLQNEDFLGKAPADVVAKVKEKHGALTEKENKLQANLEKIREIMQ